LPPAETHPPPASTPPASSLAAPRPTTFAEALAQLAEDTVPPATQRAMASAVALLERATGRPTAALPLAPIELVPLLNRVLPARLRITKKRWSNARGLLAAVAARTGHADPRAPRGSVPLTGAWAGLPARLGRRARAAALGGFARFCQARGIAPDDVDEAAFEAYRAWLAERTYTLRPNGAVSGARLAWNAGAKAASGWPGRAVAAPSDPRVRALPLGAFPASFVADLQAYLDRLADPDPLDADIGRRRSPATVVERRRFVLRAASILAEPGGTPAERITGLDALASEAAMKAVLLELHRRGGGKGWTGQAVTMAMILVHVARTHLRLPEAELAPLLALKQRVVRRTGVGLSARVRDRLAPFDDTRVLARLFRLPEELFAAADRLAADGNPTRAAETHERAVALALLLLPMRRRNLAALDAERHFLRDDQRGRIAALRIPGEEVKNGIHLEAAVPPPLARRIERHLAAHRPVLAKGHHGAAPLWLFPGVRGRHRDPKNVAEKVARTVQDALGVPFNLHLVRHLAATVLYDAHPGNEPVVQRLFAHTQLKTTRRMYGQLGTRGAEAAWAELVDGRREAIRRRGVGAAGRRGAGR
jgi:integrase